MADLNEELVKWFEVFQKVDQECHLLCPKLSDDDFEDYKTLSDPHSEISVEEKQKRIKDGEARIEMTYWNSLIFGYDKKDAGKWLDTFTDRLEHCLKLCSDCVLNWHMKRRAHLEKFAERWNEDVVKHIQELLDKLDISRIDQNLTWAKQFIEKIESTGTTFRKSAFGDKLAEVLITVYEALCCLPYMAEPDQRSTFQFVFVRLQGKTYLKVGGKDPLPGLAYFLFDQKNEERRIWAHRNWIIDPDSMTEDQFDWAVSAALVENIDRISRHDLNSPFAEVYTEIERFWLAFEAILRTVHEDLIKTRFQSLELRSGTVPNIYDLLFRHIQHCKSEAVLVVCIRVLTAFLKKAPKALWDAVGDARPIVVAELICDSPMYQILLRQSLENCWTGYEPGSDAVPFPTSWVSPWLQSLGRDRRYDACDGLVHILFNTLARNPAIEEPGQAACIRAGFDALNFTLKTFLDSEAGSGTTHLYANSIFNVFMKYRDLILENLNTPKREHLGWSTFHVATAAKSAISTAMRLDTKLFSDEYVSLRKGQQPQSAITRESKVFWEGVREMFDMASTSQQATLAEDFVLALEPLLGLEAIRPLKKTNQLEKSTELFNKSFSSATDVMATILGRISELDTTDLNGLFASNFVFQVAIGISMHGETDIAEASSEILKNWTGELSRSEAFQQITQLHSDQTLGAVLFVLDRVLKSRTATHPPWDPIRPILNMSRDVLRGLTDPSTGVLRVQTLNAKSVALVLRWWQEQWLFVSKACSNIEYWSAYIPNATMTEFCREIMELAEALIAEDGLITSIGAKARNKSETEMMEQILKPAKENFKGLENMIRLKDRWLVDVTVRVLCKILSRLRENNLEIAQQSRQLIIDACVPRAPGRYHKTTNLSDQQRAELLQALGHTEEEVVIQISEVSKAKDQIKKQSKLDAWSKSGAVGSMGGSKSNRDDVLALSKSIDSPILKSLEAQRAAAKAKAQEKEKAVSVAQSSAFKEARQRAKAEKARRDAEAIARAKKLRGETVPGEGSGMASLGLSGKDHSRSEIMVNSSDEESDSSDTDTDNQLATLSTGGQKSLDEEERRNRKILLDKMRQPVKKIKQNRSVKEMRARLIPPMERLHNTILAWEIFHKGNDPPSGPASSSVATKYTDPTSYQETFFPLLASEAWRSFVTSKDEITSKPFGMKIASRASVDSFLEVTFTMPIVKNQERGVSEGDILVVSEAESPLTDQTAKHCLARVHRITYKRELIEVTYRVASRNNSLSSNLNPGVNMYGVKITNMTTIEREYAALESLQYYDLMDEILKAEPSPVLRYSEEKVTKWMGNWALNRGQALAVLGAQDNDGFTLIQGPPGTGKTKTIVAMVGTLLSEQLSSSMGGTPLPGIQLRPGQTPQPPKTASKKLLVCAPSNAAVDEIVHRLMSGVTTISGKQTNINVLRLGRSDAINAAVKEVTLDEMVKKRLEADGTREKAKADRDKLHEDAAKIKEQLADLRPQLEEARGGDRAVYSTLSRQFDDLKRQQMQIGKQIDANKEGGNSIARETEIQRRNIQQQILNSAHVICATLSGSGHEMFRNLDVEFETVIIDEAAQCVELSALIPLKYGCCKCILVGDPKQLPPTVLSQSAARFGYDQSLFVRMQQNHPKSVHLLDMQYRMHPQISVFPSREFYEGQLKDGPDMIQQRQQPWHRTALLSPYRFFDVQGVQERGNRGQSLVNTKELEVALQMYDRFSKDFHKCDLKRKIGIITPYKAQLFELRQRFKSRYGEGITEIIEFNTTDAFQGRECEIIIFSCVRASSTGGIGFMTDIRRMNVGLTRAKSSLWILGDSRALVQGEFWKKLIEDAQNRQCYTKGDILSMFRRPLEQNQNPTAMIGHTPPSKSPTPQLDGGDVVMTDRPAIPVRSASSTPAQSAHTSRAPSVTLNGIPGLNGANPPPAVPKSSVPPLIHTSGTSTSGSSDGKKRPLDRPESGQPPATKRVAAEGSRMMGKFGQKPMKPKAAPKPPPPTDPAAMSVLGLTPPERPPAQAAQLHANGSSSASHSGQSKSSNDGSGSAGPRKPKQKSSLFVPRKR